MHAMSLREAATATGTAKSTILRAVKSGRISATRTENGGYEIDPSELARVYGPLRPAPLDPRKIPAALFPDARLIRHRPAPSDSGGLRDGTRIRSAPSPWWGIWTLLHFNTSVKKCD